MARILAVEDDPLVRHGFVSLLRQQGHELTAVGSAEAALQPGLAERQDLVLLDVGLPGMDGLACAGVLRQRRLSLPLIFLTAYGGLDFVGRAMVHEPYAYLVKPISAEQLVPIVATALAAAQAGQAKEDKLLAALQDSRDTSAAVGMLAERHQWSVEQAFAALRTMARSEGRRIVDVAAEVVRRSR